MSAHTPPSILIVDHSEKSRVSLAEALKTSGFDVHVASNVEDLQARLDGAAIQLVLLDLDLPGGAGLSTCRRLAERDDLRIIALCSAADETDAVVALEMGADDYVAKTSGRREIAARVRAQLRRAGRISGDRRLVYEFQDLRFDVLHRRLEAATGASIPLTACQASLLAALLQAGGRPLSRQELLAFVRGEGIDVLERAIDSHISRLRARLADHGGVRMISTVYRSGYQWSGGAVAVRLAVDPPASAQAQAQDRAESEEPIDDRVALTRQCA